MSYRVVQRVDLGQERWDALVQASDQAWLWHTYDHQETISTWRNRRDQSLAIVDEATDEVLAVVPLQLRRNRAGKILRTNSLNCYCGIACRNDLEPQRLRDLTQFALGTLKQLAAQQRAISLKFRLSPLAPAYRGDRSPLGNPLRELGCADQSTETWMLDLRGGVDAVWRKLKTATKQKVRKAERQRVVIRAARADDAELDVYYRLHVETYQRSGTRPHDRTFFESIWRRFLARGLSRGFVAEHEGQVVAAQHFGLFKGAAYYWISAANRTAFSVGASALLQWTAIQWMIESGFEWYELGDAVSGTDGRDRKQASISDFKGNFGPERRPFYKGICVLRPLSYAVIRYSTALRHRYSALTRPMRRSATPDLATSRMRTTPS